MRARRIGLGAWGQCLLAMIMMTCGAFGQTASDLGEGLRAELTGTPGVTAIKWWGKAGRTYFVQSSETLLPDSWQYMPVVESGNEAVCTWNLQTSASKMFVRLIYTDQAFSGGAADADFDGDGLTNGQEIAVGWGTNPFVADTDADGWDDLVENQAGSSGKSAQMTPLSEKLYYLESIRSYDVGALATNETINGSPKDSTGSTWNITHSWNYLGDDQPGIPETGPKPELEYFPWPDAALGDDSKWGVLTGHWLGGRNQTALPRPFVILPGDEWLSVSVQAFQPQRSTANQVNGFRKADWARYRLRLSHRLPFEYKEVFWEQVKTYDWPWSGTVVLKDTTLQRVELKVPAGQTTGPWVYLHPSCGANEQVSSTPVRISAGWQAKPGLNNVFDNTDPHRGQVVGKRIYPDAPESTPDAGFRRELHLRVSVPGLAGATVYVKVFDVDDPSRVNDPQHVLDPNDGTGSGRGDDNITASGTATRGFFMPSMSDELPVVLDASGAALLEFSITPQPGNNYRVAVALAEEDLDMLQVNDPQAEGYVTADDSQPRGFAGSASPLLTVWRRLHIEVDTMEAVSTPKGSPDRVAAVGDHWSGPNNEQRFVLHLAAALAGGPGFYQGGKVVAGGSEYRISNNGADWISFGQGEPQPAGLIGQIEVFDDDDIGLTAAPLPRADVISSGVKNLFKPAYIDIVKRTTGNTNPTLPFDLYSTLAGAQLPTGLDDKIDTSGDDAIHYWNHPLIVAYQPHDPIRSSLSVPADGDPDNDYPMMGLTEVLPAFGPAFSAVFIEPIREPVKYASDVQSMFQINVDDVVAHEIGHMPNGAWFGHPETGLMAEDSPHLPFAPESLRRFRSAGRWQE